MPLRQLPHHRSFRPPLTTSSSTSATGSATPARAGVPRRDVRGGVHPAVRAARVRRRDGRVHRLLPHAGPAGAARGRARDGRGGGRRRRGGTARPVRAAARAPDQAWRSGDAGAAGAGAHAAARHRRRRRGAGLGAAAPPGARRAAAPQRDLAVAGHRVRRRSTRCPTTRPTTCAAACWTSSSPRASLVTAVDGLLDGAGRRGRPARGGPGDGALDDDAADAAAVSRDVADRLDGAGAPAVGMAVRRLAAAAGDLARGDLQRMDDPPDLPADTRTATRTTEPDVSAPPSRRGARPPGCARRPAPPSRSSSPARCRSASAGSSSPVSGTGR